MKRGFLIHIIVVFQSTQIMMCSKYYDKLWNCEADTERRLEAATNRPLVSTKFALFLISLVSNLLAN